MNELFKTLPDFKPGDNVRFTNAGKKYEGEITTMTYSGAWECWSYGIKVEDPERPPYYFEFVPEYSIALCSPRHESFNRIGAAITAEMPDIVRSLEIEARDNGEEYIVLRLQNGAIFNQKCSNNLVANIIEAAKLFDDGCYKEVEHYLKNRGKE